MDQRRIAALDRILELVVLVGDDMTRSLARDGLTRSRTHLLWVLRTTGPSTQRALADALQVSARTVTGLVDGLVATGFVTRERHPNDRRATLVTFTERATKTIEAMERDQAEFAEVLFDGMPAARFECLVDGLDDILDRLRERGLSHRIQGEEQ